MASTRRSASQDVGRNVPTSNPSLSSSPTIEQALMMQTQLLQTTAQSVLNNPQEAPPINKHGTFSHASDPLEADDWLRDVDDAKKYKCSLKGLNDDLQLRREMEEKKRKHDLQCQLRNTHPQFATQPKYQSPPMNLLVSTDQNQYQ